mmetsp:Transcript_84918/g.274498  ORF Transcript_84918/g.274498 Transcript_84918/m.274498 type:complete len:197 (+) Transcript_84918:133-723(+)
MAILDLVGASRRSEHTEAPTLNNADFPEVRVAARRTGGQGGKNKAPPRGWTLCDASDDENADWIVVTDDKGDAENECNSGDAEGSKKPSYTKVLMAEQPKQEVEEETGEEEEAANDDAEADAPTAECGKVQELRVATATPEVGQGPSRTRSSSRATKKKAAWRAEQLQEEAQDMEPLCSDLISQRSQRRISRRFEC